MNSSTHDKTEGTAKEAMGTIKEKTGQAIGNPDLQDRGTMEKAEGNVTRAASYLGVSRPTLYQLLDRYGIKKKSGDQKS